MATIVPDPVGSFTSAFQVADTASRDRARIALQERQMAENAVERAEQRKAENFNRMLRYISEGNRAAEIAANNRRLDAQLGISSYNAQTSRINALRDRTRPSTYSDDPLGLAGPSSTPTPQTTSIPDAPLDIPMPTGEFGSGIDANVSNRNNPALRALEADIELAQSGGLPESYATTPNSPLIEIPPPPEAMVEGTAVEEVPVAGPAPAVATPIAIPAPVADTTAALLPPPVDAPSFSEADISASTRDTLAGLERDSKAAAQQAQIKQRQATRTASYLQRGNLQNPEAYRALAEQQENDAMTAAATAQDAASRAARIKEDLPKVQKRQEILTSLSDLDTVLPPAERAELVRITADPATGGQADRQLATLAAYSKVRNERGLTYRSNGIRTADMVARAGANLATDDARKERQAADEVRIAQSGLAAITNPESEESKEEAKAYRKILRDNAAGAAAWDGRLKLFNDAVKADTAPEAPTTTSAAPVAVDAPVAAPAVPVDPDFITAANNSRQSAAPQGPQMTPAEMQGWTASKNALLEGVGGVQAIRELIQAGSPVETLNDLKNVVRTLLSRQETPRGPAAIQSGSTGFVRGLPALPRNARSYGDVADALAEDLWRQTGRAADARAVPGAPAIRPENRAVVDRIRAQMDAAVK